MDLEGSEVEFLAIFKSLLTVLNINDSGVILVVLGKRLVDIKFKVGHIVVHHFTAGDLIPHIVQHFREVSVPDLIIFLKSNEQILFLWS